MNADGSRHIDWDIEEEIIEELTAAYVRQSGGAQPSYTVMIEIRRAAELMTPDRARERLRGNEITRH